MEGVQEAMMLSEVVVMSEKIILHGMVRLRLQRLIRQLVGVNCGKKWLPGLSFFRWLNGNWTYIQGYLWSECNRIH